MAVYTTIDNPELYFQCKIWSGDGTAIGSGGLSVTLDGSENMQPDMVYVKRRDHTNAGQIHDAVRGATKFLPMDGSTDAEETNSETLTAFNSDGFTVGSHNGVNNASGTYVAWCWKESATAGFDIVTYTGNQTARTISHSLSAVPHWMVIKNSGSSYSLQVYHHKNTSAPETEIMYWNQTAATSDSNVEWNDTAPTSSVFTVGTDVGVNQTSQSHITYLWSEKQGYSKFGSYTGNGNADGTFVYTGFRPAWVMVKITSGTDNWNIVDNKRATYNEAENTMRANLTNAEYTGTAYGIDILSNGFKCRTDDGNFNGSSTYVYMAFAEAPFVNSKGVPANAR